MKRFVTGVSRDQATLFPEHLEDFIADDNPVRVVEAFVEALDLRTLGFSGVDPQATGRPAYHPAVLLKLYIYGYLNRIPSSRRLEREAQRNVELMWLTERLAPDFKTIADFRKDNGKAIIRVCRQFVGVCRQLGLFSQALVAIDGSKFKAVNNRDNNFTRAKSKARIAQVERAIAHYLEELERADRAAPDVAEVRVAHLKDKLASLKRQMTRLQALERQRRRAPDQQISLTDPDARCMATNGKGTGVVGYNVQTAVDTQHHLIVAHEVVTTGSDRSQLTKMARQAREAMCADELSVLADRGYFKSEELLACAQAGITTYVPKPQTSGNQARGLFRREDFHYDPTTNEYRCPAGERLTWRYETVEGGLRLHCYWSSACSHCAIKARCTTGAQRRIKRWEHEAVLEAAQARLDHEPGKMRLRRQTVEHPFGTLKTWMGHSHFLTRTLPRVSTEISLHVLAYNMKRVMKLLGVGPMVEAVAMT